MKKQKGPWVVTDSNIVYQNPWIKVHEDKVIRPDKKPGIFGIVEMKSGVSIIPVDEKGNVYLTIEYKYAVERMCIEAIGGGIDKSENKLQAAKRELKEETGLVAKKWIYLGVVDPFTSVISSPNHMYLAENLTQKKSELDGTEILKVVKMPLKKAIDMVMKSKITHGATCVALLKIKDIKLK